MVINLLSIVAGLVLLVAGGEALVRGASSLARRIGMSALVVGLTVVSVSTSSPELAVSIGATLGGQGDLAVGNVVGSNIANVLLILGLGAVLIPLVVVRQLVRLDIPVMIALSIVMLILGMDGAIGTVDGIVLITLFIAAIVATILMSRREPQEEQDDAEVPASVLRSVVLVGVGIAALVFGAQFLVNGAVAIATALGVSELVIGLTVVAIGTSLPELAATIVAVRRGEVDIAVGNVVGSNIANIGLVLGIPAIIGTVPVAPAAIALDIPLMIAVAVLCGALAFTGLRVERWEGWLFIVLYGAYLAYLVLASTQHDALSGFTSVMVYFVLPALAIFVLLVVFRDVQRRRNQLVAPAALD